MKSRLAAIVLAAVTTIGHAQQTKEFSAVFTEVPPEIDGDVSDAVWSSASLVDDFHQVDPIENGPVKDKLTIRVLYDENFLYVAADIVMKVLSDMTAFQSAQGTSVRNDDTISVILDPFNNQRSGYKFDLNANGVRAEALFDGPGHPNGNWTGIWNGAAKIHNNGWAAEFAIPFKTLNFNPVNSTWGISFALRVFARNVEKIAWTSKNREVVPGTLGEMTDVTEAQQGRGLDIKVSASGQHSRDHELGVQDTAIDPSVDVFYKVTPSLTAALTVNTDFSATEVDDRVVNLSRFSLFFPEKRAFFLQDADMFSFGGLGRNGIPFFSRRIGLDENRQPIDIVAGGKLTGRAGPFNVGILNVIQESLGDDVNLFVGRASMNVLDNSTVGVIVTDGSPVDGESNTVVGADFNFVNRDLLGGKGLRGNTWYQQSHAEGNDGDQDAWGIGVNVPRTTGWSGGVGFNRIGENFDPALGFVNRQGIREFEAEIDYRFYPESGPFLWYGPSASYERVEDLAGNVESESFNLTPFFVSNHYVDWFRVFFARDREVLTEDFEISDGIVISAGDYSWNKVGGWVDTGQQRKLQGRLSYATGDFYDGKRTDISAATTWTANNRFSMTASVGINDVELAGGSFVSRVYSLRSTLAISSDWSWITLAQYDNRSDEVGINTRLRWVPQPGQEMIFVLNHGYRVEADPDDPLSRPKGSTVSDLVLKGTYTYRF